MKPLTKDTIDQLLNFLADVEEYVFLDSSRIDKENNKSFLFLHPEKRLEFFVGDDPAVFLRSLEDTLAQGKYLAGWMGYEFGYLLEQRLATLLPITTNDSPLVSFGVFAEPAVFQHQNGNGKFPLSSSTDLPDFNISNIRPSQERESYLDAVSKIKEYIAAGDTYQVNYTLKLLFDFSGSAEQFYSSLRGNQSVSYGAMMRLGKEHILSLSPELFFRVEDDRVLVRPMKGTMKRGRDCQEDLAFCVSLAGDSKNRSENVMIVDLLRNDLGRLIHQYGDDKVVTESLFDVERYESVLQMTSTVSVRTEKNVFSKVSLLAFLKALFPCGSVTGAPKIRTMEIIRELEQFPRGVYTGAIGYFAPTGKAVFNVPIRTIRLSKDKGEMGIGSGIVHDSDPVQEWEECLLKAHFLTRPFAVFSLIETLLLEEKGRYLLLDYHLQRLQQSAEYYSFNFDKDYVLSRLNSVRDKNREGALRVRLALQKDGTVEIESVSCDVPVTLCLPAKPEKTSEPLPVIALSAKTVDSTSSFFFHKTSNRELFTGEFASALANGLFDIVFLNDSGMLTEGCITNIVLYLDGRYVTPVVSSGLLAGTMRRKLLADDNVPLYEEVLTLADLQRAEAIFCCNSVRGVVRVQLQ